MHNYVIALAGNPNAGKTTIFNGLTGARQHVANYPGVTVEKKEGYFEYLNAKFKVVDLPGTYSLSAYSIEEIIARNFIIEEKPDVVIDIIDTSNLERNLYLAVQILELGIPVILVFNMVDEAKKRGIKIQIEKFSKLLNGLPIVETIGNKGIGIDNLKKTIYEFCKNKKNFYLKLPNIDYGEHINQAIKELQPLVETNKELIKKYNPKWLALKLLEKDKEIIKTVQNYFPKDSELFKKLNMLTDKLSKIYNDELEIIIAEKRYGFISGICTEAVINTVEFRHDISDVIDKVLTNKFLGIPIFLILMYLTFQLTFSLGSIPMEWIDNFFIWLGNFIKSKTSIDPLLKSLIVDGVLGGVGSVLIFLPNIILLFLAIGILEFTGYMSRAAFILDKIMHQIGLHGKSFIPMLIGFGCNVPGIMATRTLNTEKERLITILILPLMSCGARLPVYLLIIPAFFPQKFQAPILWGIYIFGIFLAILFATLLSKFAIVTDHTPFIMELPPYRLPTLKAIILYIWEKSSQYLKKAGTIILALSIILWFLSYFPQNTTIDKKYEIIINSETKYFDSEIEKFAKQINISKEKLKKLFQTNNPNLNNFNKQILKVRNLILKNRFEEAKTYNFKIATVLINTKLLFEEYNEKIKQIKNKLIAEKAENSYIGRLGKSLSFIFKPLGFDWKLTTAIVAAIPAKEVFVSQLGIINAVGETDETSETLREKIKRQYSPLIGFCVIIWILIASPCIATIAVTKKETNSWKWALVQFLGLTIIAYIITLIVYQIGKIFLT